MEKIKQIFKNRTLTGSIIAIIAMALVAILYFYPDDVAGNVLRQSDMQQGAANGQEAKAYYEATGETPRWTGSLFSGMPTFQIAPSYSSNALFDWLNTLMGLGLPEPANLLFMMMVGFFILLLCMKMRWYVALIGAIAYGFSSYFVILIAAGHIWKFVTLAYIPPTIAGIVLCYRGRYLAGAALAALFAMLQIASNHVQMTYYFLFVIIGFVIAFLIKAISDKKMRQWGVATGALAVAAILAVTANLPSLYNTYEYSKETIRGGHSELTSKNSSSTSADGLDRDYITHYSYECSETFTLLIPNVKGGATMKPEQGSARYMSLNEMPEAQELVDNGSILAEEAQYLDWVPQYFGGPEGTNGPVYVGALIAALFLLGCVIVKGPMKWMLILLTLFSIFLALGRNCMWLTDLAIDYLPMYSKFRTVESILVIAEFTMPLLAVMALQQLLKGDPAEAWKRYRKPIMITFGIAAVFCLAGMMKPDIFGAAVTEADRQNDQRIAYSIAMQAEQGGFDASAVLQVLSLDNPHIYGAIENLRYSLVRSDSLRSLIIIAAGLGILLLYFYKKLSMATAAILSGIVVLGDMYLINKRYLNTDSFVAESVSHGDPFPRSQVDDYILADTTMNFRVFDIARFDQAAPSYYHKMLGGYHAAKLTRYQDIIDRHISPLRAGDASQAHFNVINMLNARYVIDASGNAMFNNQALGNAWFVDRVVYADNADAEMQALDTITPATTAVADKRFAGILGKSTPKMVGDTIFETSYAPHRLTYHTHSAKGGVAVISEVYFPWGWKATIDGAPVQIGRVNYVLRALNIPAGDHSVELLFDPESLHNTTNAAYVAIILIYLAVIGAVVMAIVRPRVDDEESDGDTIDKPKADAKKE